MASGFKDKLAHQLALPSKGFMGFITNQILKFRNGPLEKNVVRLCDIQPHHQALELGFGPGIGIEHAVNYIGDGPGKIYGLDLSPYMLEKAASRLKRPIQEKNVELTLGTVMELPYSTDFFDRIYHCNCYYFWPNMEQSLAEIYRVMKPGAFMVTALNIDSLKAAESKGFLKYGKPDPVNYMTALEAAGFKDVKMEHYSEGDRSYQAIFAYLPAKPSLHSCDQEQDESEAYKNNLNEAGLNQSVEQ